MIEEKDSTMEITAILGKVSKDKVWDDIRLIRVELMYFIGGVFRVKPWHLDLTVPDGGEELLTQCRFGDTCKLTLDFENNEQNLKFLNHVDEHERKKMENLRKNII